MQDQVKVNGMHPISLSHHKWSSAKTARLVEIMIDTSHACCNQGLLYSTNPQRGGGGGGGRGGGERSHERHADRVAFAYGVVREADEVGYVYYILIHLTLPSFTFVSYFYNTTGEGKAT